MAKSKSADVNKSDLIRGVLAERPDATTANIVEHIKKKHGVTIAAGLVYLIKSKSKGKKYRRVSMPAVQTTMTALPFPRNHGKSDVINIIRKAKELAADVGGMPKLKAIVEAISE